MVTPKKVEVLHRPFLQLIQRGLRLLDQSNKVDNKFKYPKNKLT
jgi:hypothetical protein